MLANFSLFSGFKRSSNVPSGSFAKAASVGANTVNGPSAVNALSKPVAFNAVSKVLNEPLA